MGARLALLAGIAMLSAPNILAAPTAGGPSVLAVTEKNVHSALLQSETPVLLAFTATWCGHCQQLKPRFNAAAADPYLQGRVTFANIDCESDKPICEEFGVQGYPTVLFVPPNTGSFKAAHAAAQRYAGQRSTQAIRDYLLRVLRKEPLVFLQREFANGAAAGSGAELALAHERQYTALSAANFSLKRLIRGLGRDGVAFALVLPDASSSGDVGGQLAESVDYSSSTAAADSGAHPLVSAAIAAAEKLRAELTILAVQEQDVHATPALAAALAPVLALQRSGDLSGKEPLLVQVQAGEARVEVARVGCEGAKGAAAAAAPAGAAQQRQEEDVTSPSPQLGLETVRHVPCDPATGIPLSHSRAAGALADAVARWIRTHRFPAVSALSPDNFPLLANNEGTYLAIAVVNETQIAEYRARRDAAPAGGPVLLPPRSALFLTSFEKLAARSSTSLPPAVRARFLFGFLDAALHAESFLSQFNVSPSDAPQLLVIDIPSKRYWHDRSVFEYEEQESQLEDIASGRAPVHRQGMLAVPQRLINSLGVVPAVAIGALLVVVVAWGVWRLVLAELLGYNAPVAAAAASGKGVTVPGSEAAASNGTGAGRRGSAHSEDMQLDAGSTGPASRSSATGPPSSRGGASGAPAAAAAAGGLGRAVSDRSDMDIDEGGEAFHRVGEHDEDIDGSDEDEGAAGGARRAGEGIRRRAAAAAAAASKDSDASDSASESAPARRPVGRHASRRRVDE